MLNLQKAEIKFWYSVRTVDLFNVVTSCLNCFFMSIFERYIVQCCLLSWWRISWSVVVGNQIRAQNVQSDCHSLALLLRFKHNITKSHRKNKPVTTTNVRFVVGNSTNLLSEIVSKRSKEKTKHDEGSDIKMLTTWVWLHCFFLELNFARANSCRMVCHSQHSRRLKIRGSAHTHAHLWVNSLSTYGAVNDHCFSAH